MKNPGLFLGFCLSLQLLCGCRGFNPGPRFDPYPTNNMAGGVTNASVTPAFEDVGFSNQVDSALLVSPTAPFTLGPGDKLDIELIDDLNSKALVTVGPDGKIYFGFLPGLDVWGLTLNEAKTVLERETMKFVKETPQLALTLRQIESKRVWLMGRIVTPGVYPMSAPVTLLEAISHAGGLQTVSQPGQITTGTGPDEMADLESAFVIRNGQYLPVSFKRLLHEGDLSQNIFLQPDDYVFLPSVKSSDIQVMGAVFQPCAVPYTGGVSLVAAVSHSYGPAKDAFLTEVAIVRGSLSNPKIAIVNYREITRGRQRDVELQPRDIVYVPYTPYRGLKRYADLILNTFVNSVAINEGARAVIKESSAPAGVFIPLGSRITITPGPPTR